MYLLLNLSKSFNKILSHLFVQPRVKRFNLKNFSTREGIIGHLSVINLLCLLLLRVLKELLRLLISRQIIFPDENLLAAICSKIAYLALLSDRIKIHIPQSSNTITQFNTKK